MLDEHIASLLELPRSRGEKSIRLVKSSTLISRHRQGLWMRLQQVRNLYCDSEGIWDGIHWDGKRASFFALRETDEGRARIKLLDRE